METNERTIEVPAEAETAAIAEEVGKKKATGKATGKNMTPTQLAVELGVDPKRLRRHLREEFGVQHKAWTITPDMAKTIRAKFAKKSK